MYLLKLRDKGKGANAPSSGVFYPKKKKRPCNSLTLLVEVRANRKQFLRVNFLSEANLSGS